MTHSTIRLACVSGLLIAATAVAPVATADPPGPGCDGHWGTRVQGAPPNFDAGDRGGVYLWHDNGFHLRATHRGDDHVVYSGTIVSPTPMHIAPVGLEANDHADLSPDGRTLWFSFNDYGRVDGVDFTTDCADYLVVGPLAGDNLPLPPGRVYLGANEVHPDHDPLTISRHEQ